MEAQGPGGALRFAQPSHTLVEAATDTQPRQKVGDVTFQVGVMGRFMIAMPPVLRLVRSQAEKHVSDVERGNALPASSASQWRLGQE